MKRMLFAGALLLAATGSTLAADLPPSMPPPPPPPRAPAYVPVITPQYNWGGIYIGINGGYGFGNSTWTTAGGAGSTGSFSIKGPLVGGTLGANFQSGMFVFGIEGDGDWTNITGTFTDTTGAATGCVGCSFQTSNSWLGTLRARAGVAWDRVLLYATGGGAGGNIKANISDPGFTGMSPSTTEFGWTAGGGLEFAITDNITAKVEYLYVDLQNTSFTCPAGTCAAAAITGTTSFDTSLVRAGLNLKFNPF
jgi:outer membrane immunogenic protein